MMDIRQGNTQVLRFLLTLFGAVRMILGDGSLDINSIEEISSSDPLMEDTIMEKLKTLPWFQNLKQLFKLESKDNLK